MMKASRTGTVCVLAIVAVVTTPCPSAAQDPVTTPLIAGKLIVDDLLNNAAEKVKDVTDRARQAGELVTANLGRELQLAIANLNVMLDGQRQKTFAELTEQQQQLFHNINRSLDRLDKLLEDGREKAGLVNLDLLRTLNSAADMLPGGKPTQDFYISSIRGATFAHGDQEYKVSVVGLDIGMPGNMPQCDITVLVDDKPLPAAAFAARTDNNRLDVIIPPEVLKPKFQQDKIGRVDLVVRSKITKGSKAKDYQVSVPLLLLPTQAGELQLEQMVTKKRWTESKQTKTISLSRLTKGELEERKESWECAANQRIAGVRYEAKGNLADWCIPLRRPQWVAGRPGEKSFDDSPGYVVDGRRNILGKMVKYDIEADYDVTDSGRKATVYRKLQVFPVTCHYHIDYQTEETASETAVTRLTQLAFAEVFAVRLPPTNPDGNFKITGRLSDGRKVWASSGGSDGPLKLVSRDKLPDGTYRLAFRLEK